MCRVDSALPTVNLPGALESRWESIIFSNNSRQQSYKIQQEHRMGWRQEKDGTHCITCSRLEELPLVLVYPRELLTSYWRGGIRGISSMLDTVPRLSSEARLRCSSGPPERTGGDTPIPALTSTEPQLFLPLASLSRPILKHNHYHSMGQNIQKVHLKELLCWVTSQRPEVRAPLNSWRTR